MTSLADLEPQAVWKHFAALAAIPRRSGNEAAARDYVVGVAKRLGLDAEHDGAGNTVIRKPAHAGREAAPMALLQGHLDMVCEKNEGTLHNFDSDPISVVRNDDWLKADGTTLGADNGIGVASALAVMESADIAHGPLEFAFTIDEESGLTGAVEFPAGLLKAKYFLNLDNEETGTLCIGCSGGIKTTARRKVALKPVSKGAGYRIKVGGLKGGHSGIDIHQGRGNALRLLGGVLHSALDSLPVKIASLDGGSAQNAIPREAVAVVVMNPAKEKKLRTMVARVESEAKSDFGSFDPGVSITVEKVSTPEQVFSASDARNAVALLVSVPHGMLAMSPDVPGLTQNSTNLAITSTKGDTVEFVTSQRSAIDSSMMSAARMVAAAFRLAGYDVEHSGRYPGWKPDPHSDIVGKVQAVHEELFGSPAKLIAMHAGLECGVIGEKYPGMQMISFGPTIIGAHSPDERVKISTVQSFWRLLRTVLERL